MPSPNASGALTYKKLGMAAKMKKGGRVSWKSENYVRPSSATAKKLQTQSINSANPPKQSCSYTPK